MGPSNFTPNSTVRRIIKWSAIGVLALLLLITFTSSTRSVDTGKIGVVTQYGRVTGRELSEGFAWVLPWGANNVTEYDIKTQKVESTAPAATKDLQDVKATIVLTYTLNAGKVSEIHQDVGKNYQAIDIDPQVIEGFKAVSAKFTAQELITNRAEVKKQVVENIKATVEKNGRYTIQELDRVRVQAEKDIAAAQGASEAQRLQLQTLTPELLRKMELENQANAIAKWNGILPTTQAGETTLFNIPAGR